MSELHTKMTALANAVREKAGVSDKLTIAGMTEAVNNLRVGGTDTSDATAESADILMGKTAYVNDKKITGGMYNYGAYEETYPSNAESIHIVKPGFYSSIHIAVARPNLTNLEITPDETTQTFIANDGNIENGTEYFDFVKVNPIPEKYVFTGDATAEANDIAAGKTAYVTGKKVTGTLTIHADSIKAGVTILGIEGTFSADATAEAKDIAAGKTAYVMGKKVTGTMLTSGGVSPVWQTIESRLFPVVLGAATMQTPSNRSQNFIVVDGKLLYIPQNMGEVKILFPEMTWTYARTRMGSESSRAYAISDGKLYHIHNNSDNEYEYTCLTPGMSGISQVVDASPDWVFFLAGTDIYLGSDDGPDVYTHIEGISVSKIINQPAGYYSAIVITTDGSVAKVSQGEYDNSTGKWNGEHEILYPAQNDYFHSVYYAEPEEFEGMGGGGYVLAVRDSGLWYQTPGSSSWQRVPGDFGYYSTAIPQALPGYCATYAEERMEWDEDTGEEKWWMEAHESTVAFWVTVAGEGYVIRAQCTANGSLTGIVAEQLEGDKWQYLPPYMGSQETAWAQRDGKLYQVKTSRPSGESRIQLTFTEEERANPRGRLIASFDKNLFFAPDGADVDMTKAGGSFSARG